MSKRTQREAVWCVEVAHTGIAATLADRLTFHGGLYLKFAAEHCGCCIATAQKHLDRMVNRGQAEKEFRGNDWLYRHIPA